MIKKLFEHFMGKKQLQKTKETNFKILIKEIFIIHLIAVQIKKIYKRNDYPKIGIHGKNKIELGLSNCGKN